MRRKKNYTSVEDVQNFISLICAHHCFRMQFIAISPLFYWQCTNGAFESMNGNFA